MSQKNIIEIKNLDFDEQFQSTKFALKVKSASIHSILFKNSQLKKQLLNFLKGEKKKIDQLFFLR